MIVVPDGSVSLLKWLNIRPQSAISYDFKACSRSLVCWMQIFMSDARQPSKFTSIAQYIFCMCAGYLQEYVDKESSVGGSTDSLVCLPFIILYSESCFGATKRGG